MFDPNQTILAGVDRGTLQTWLSAAQAAYQQLVMGAKVASASYDGKSVTYTQTDSAKLENWITLLQRQLGLNRGRRAMRVYFR
jgi:hypothetical protein